MKRRDPLIRVRWFLFGLWEHRWGTHSGAHDWRALDAYWAGVNFGRRLPRPIRRLFPKRGRR